MFKSQSAFNYAGYTANGLRTQREKEQVILPSVVDVL